jgi:hypothetical protein
MRDVRDGSWRSSWPSVNGLPIVVGLVTLSSCLGSTAVARADDLVVSSDLNLDGDQVYEQVQIDAVVTVPALSSSSPGWLRIFADRITIGAQGHIDADGAGFNAANPGPGAGVSLPQPTNDTRPAPGGGGSHIGAGTQGLWGEATMTCPGFPAMLCDPYPGADAGPIYDDAMGPAVLTDPGLGLGSAGGRSWAGCPNPTTELPGGRGGGVVVLQANDIQIQGRVSVNGVAAPEASLTSPGGGAGGTILISASKTFTVGAQAAFEAAGGDGRAGNAVGGAGGGGLIVFAVSADVSNLLATDCPGTGAACTGVAGGITSPCMPAAQAGARVSRDPLPCPDADDDGFTNAGCADPQSLDCNDADPTINPDGEELCDGVDNDCDGSTDEQDEEGPVLCGEGTGEICVDGTCQPDDSGQGGGGETPAPASPRLHLEGGLCAWRSPLAGPDGSAGRLWGLFLAMAVAALGWRRRLGSLND